jgi:tRNA-Thr(GGU) m(6)t(6)A37 methyltransferase TsaA
LSVVAFAPIGLIETPFKEKFGIPRQAGLTPAATGLIRLFDKMAEPACVAGLEGFSHLWLLWHFDASAAADWQPSVRPPRLGGNRRVGVFASRSPFRPNAIGLSVVKLDAIELVQGRVQLRVAGVDMRDGTPLLDIKPYLPYCDAIPDALAGYAQQAPQPQLQVVFAAAVVQQLSVAEGGAQLAELIRQVITLDPRPAYRQTQDGAYYAMRLGVWDVRWQVTAKMAEIVALVRLSD